MNFLWFFFTFKMTQLTNAKIDSLYEEALEKNNSTVLLLISEIDLLKSVIGKSARKLKRNKAIWSYESLQHKRKYFARGQGYMRAKISQVLNKAGLLEATEIASKTHIDYEEP